MNHIKNYLPQFMSSGQHERNWKLHLMNEWNSIMGSLSSKVSICKIYNNSITLGVTDSSWMQELHLLSGLIQDKINKSIGQPRIELIRFKYVSEHVAPDTKKQTSLPACNKEKALTAREKQAIQDIKDPELSQALLGFLQLCHKFS